jgi:hypothetical protein
VAIRTERQYPSVYFGRPGALVTMPYPPGDMDRSFDRAVFDFPTGGGQHMVSQLAAGTRLYALTWNALHVDNFKAIEQYWTGNMGTGPWAFIDPATTNMLRPNQSGATSLYNDTRAWATGTGLTSSGTLSSNSVTTLIHRPGAPRSLRWLFTVAAAAAPELRLTPPYRSWWGFPVAPGLSYSWSAWARPDGTVDSNITCAAKLRWLDSAGAQISEISGGDIAMATWTRLSIIGAAPGNAAYCQPVLVATGATITTGASIYVDEPMLEQDTILNDWAPGVGIRPVEIVGLPEVAPFEARFRKGLTLTLRELAQ